MSIELVQIDAFASQPFTGNPAAVCLLEAPADAEWMQRLALEMNLSETAFLVPRDDGYDLRWFTPATEVDLCGHATLASAHFLWTEGHLGADKAARFHTRSGLLTCTRNGDWIAMDFPTQSTEPIVPPPELETALDAEPLWVGKNRSDFLVEVNSEQTLRALVPDMGHLAALEARGIIVTAATSEASRAQGIHFVSRFFGPSVGVPEDPVTGSAHCALAPFWAERLGERELVGYQASARGGTVRVTWDGESRVRLEGQAVTVLRAQLVV